jgi:hypothetical protein
MPQRKTHHRDSLSGKKMLLRVMHESVVAVSCCLMVGVDSRRCGSACRTGGHLAQRGAVVNSMG